MTSIFDDLDALISVDIESAGPIPSEYALLSIGACTLTHPRQTFYIELRPDKDRTDPSAMQIHGLSPERLQQEGIPPAEAMEKFAAWLEQVVPAGRQPLMVAFNAPFDWMFIHDYFMRCLGRSPFGHSAVDIKAVYLGATGCTWADTSGPNLHRRYDHGSSLTHNALDDALSQAAILEGILQEFFSR
jgi:ribonuclease T